MDHKLSRLTDGVDLLEDTHAVTQAVDTMLRIVAKAPDGLKTDQLLMRMAKRFNFKPERLELRLKGIREETQRRERFRTGQQGNSSERSRITPRQSTPGQNPTRPSVLADDLNAALQQATSSDDAITGAIHQNQETRQAIPPEKLRPLASLERDLFETLIENPELAMTAVEAIDPDWLETNTAKMLLSAYQDLEFDGHQLDIDSLLLLVENEQLKNLLVTLHERVQRRGTSLPQTADERYNAVMLRLREFAFSHEQSKKIEQLASELLPEEEEVAILEAMIAEARSKHGIQNAPKSHNDSAD